MSNSIHEITMRLLTKIKQDCPKIGFVTHRNDCSIAAACGLALGCKVLVLHSVDEIDDFLKSVNAVVLDTSAVHFLEQKSILSLMAQFKKRKMPWVFMPSDVEYYTARRETVKIILARKPTALCARDTEIAALTASQGTIVNNILRRFSKDYTDMPRLVLGKTFDHVVDSHNKSYVITGVDDILPRISSHNLLHGLVLANFLAASDSKVDEALPAAALTIKAAIRRALSVTNGPGSFAPVFIDAFYHLKRDYLYQITIQQDHENIQLLNETPSGDTPDKEVMFM